MECSQLAHKMVAPQFHKVECGRIKDIPITTAVGDYAATCQGRTDRTESKDLLSIPQVFSLDVLE